MPATGPAPKAPSRGEPGYTPRTRGGPRSRAWLQRQVGIVLQENVLFSGSVRENIALADPGAPIEEHEMPGRLSTPNLARSRCNTQNFLLKQPQYSSAVGPRNQRCGLALCISDYSISADSGHAMEVGSYSPWQILLQKSLRLPGSANGDSIVLMRPK